MGQHRQRIAATEDFDAAPLLQYAGAVLATKRKALRPRVTQTHVAFRIGLSRSAIGAFEDGRPSQEDRAGISLQKLLHWAALFGLSMGDIFPGTPSPALQWFTSLPPHLQEAQHRHGVAWEQYNRCLTGASP